MIEDNLFPAKKCFMYWIFLQDKTAELIGTLTQSSVTHIHGYVTQGRVLENSGLCLLEDARKNWFQALF
jgi:hypothetical protein